MIDQEKCKAVFLLHEEGMSSREISKNLKISRKTVRKIITHKGDIPANTRSNKKEISREVLEELYIKCSGFRQRMYEILTEEKGFDIGYSTMTRALRQYEIGTPKNTRCDKVPDEPGAEMQHDTSTYVIELNGKKAKVVGSLLYFRYSKVRYLKFYVSFTRFKMKCFLWEALNFFKYVALLCIIDNTNLAVLRGTGEDAVFVTEMLNFISLFGSRFKAHRKGHCNRKAGEERGFWTVETSFFPGRTFKSLEDLNAQALEWATKKFANRPQSRSGLIPSQAFEYEKQFLIKIPSFIPAPYCVHERGVDNYGYAQFNGNFFWVPGTSREEVRILEYDDHIVIFQARKKLAEYKLPFSGIKNERISPEGFPKSVYIPKSQRKPEHEEEYLQNSGPTIKNYMEFISSSKGIQKNKFIRELYTLQKRLSPELFEATIKRALQYKIINIRTIEKIAVLQIKNGGFTIPSLEISEDFENRDNYREGAFTDSPDFSKYEKLITNEDENG